MDVDSLKGGDSEPEDESGPSVPKAPAANQRSNKTASEMYQQVGSCHSDFTTGV